MELFFALAEVKFITKKNIIENLPLDKYLFIFKGWKLSIYNSINSLPIFSMKITNISESTEFYTVFGWWITVEIKIANMEGKMSLFWLSKNKLVRVKEKVLQNDLYGELIQEWKINILSKEYKTPYGNIDILAEKEGIYNILELKKDRIKLEDIKQGERYREYFKELGEETKVFVIGTSYSTDKKEYWDKHNITVCNYDEIKEKIYK